ncbi:unnamed protein product, partial [Symbiodinium sp. CCMP2456]
HADWLALEDSTGVFKAFQDGPRRLMYYTAVARLSILPGLHCIWHGAELDDMLADTPASVHVCANVQSDWWLRIFAIRPVHIAAISPPCQPWSAAGSGAGLASDDGLLMLRAADILGAVQVPVVVLEQVAGFLRHPHADTVLSAFSIVGYSIVWQATIDLLDVLPCSRSTRTYRPPLGLFAAAQSCDCADRPRIAKQVAALHGAVRPILLQEAAAGLAYACHALGCKHSPEPAEAVARCLSARVHNANAFFLPRGQDWILCRKDQVFELLASGAIKPLPTPSQPAPVDFVPVTFQSRQTDVTVYAPSGAPALRVFSHLGVAHLAPTLPAAAHDRLHALRLSVELPPSLDCAGFVGGCADKTGLCTVLVANGVFIVDTWSPRMWTQLLNVFDFLTPEAEDLCCWSPSGHRLQLADDFEGCVVANTSPPEAARLPLSLLAASVPALQATFQAHEAQLACPAVSAIDLWLGFPFHLVLAYGWDAQVENFPPAHGASMFIRMQPLTGRVHMQPPALPRQLRAWFLVARLDAASVSATAEGSMQVEVQVEAQRIWWGYLPALLRVAQFDLWWREASQVCQLPPDARVFSGPFPVSAEDSLLAVHSRRGQRVLRKNGHLLITLQPSVVGGGVKDEQKHWAQTRAASVCLAQGLDLRTTTAFIDEVSTEGSTARLSQAIKATSEDAKWAQLTAYAKDLGVPVPQTTSLFQRADQRAKRQFQKRRSQAGDQLRASSVQVQTGFFVNDDGSQTQILDSIRPGATGLLLVDGDQAGDALATLQGVQPDELGILVLGHTCPNPDSCSRRVSFPATGRACGSQLLLAGCLHNVGGKAIRPSQQTDITVALPDILCCTFTAFSDEFPAGQWEQIVQAPVKQILSVFQDIAAAKTIATPWGRQFRCKGKVASPAAADQVSFQARVPKSEAEALLIASGHNCVYITPRTLDSSLLPGYSIIWIGGQRQDAVKASLQIPEQRGLVRSKDRFGLRVPEARYEAAYGLIRPGQTAPNRVAVQYLFRVGPVPAGADATAVSTWAAKFNWSIKIIRASGPSHWLVGAAQQPPSAWPLFNSQTVLINPVHQREVRQSVVQSGSLSTKAQATPPAAAKEPRAAEDPWLFSDPWSASRSSVSSLGSRESGSRFPAPAPAPVNRVVAGPTEQRFQQQETRIHALEEGIQALKILQEQNHGQLVQQQATDRQNAAQATAGLQEQLSSVGTELTRQLQASAEALQNAQTQQQKQMQCSLDELKSLFLESREHRAAAKKPKIAWGEVLHQCVDVDSLSAAGVVALSKFSFLLGAGVRASPFRSPAVHPFQFDDTYTVLFPCGYSASYLGQFDCLRGCRIGEAQNPGPFRQTDIRQFRSASAGTPELLVRTSENPPALTASSPGSVPQAPPQSGASADSPPSSTAAATPASFPLRLAVINPTSLLHKDREILDLGQDVILASETSAVEAVQRIVAHKLRPAGFTTLWSAPVSPHQGQRENQSTLRGHAAGVALISRLPARKSFVPLEPQVAQASRLLESHLRIGQFELRVFVVYGYPANYQDAGGRNAALLLEVLRRLIACPVPAIIGGDFNTDITQLPEFGMFQQLGFVEAFQYWQARTGQELPPTCKQATRHDTLLLPGSLLQYVQDLRVATDLHFFDSHAPFMAEFLLPERPPCLQTWRMPASWMSFLPQGTDLTPFYARYQCQVQAAIQACRTTDELDAAFQTWASAVEAAVDTAVRAAHTDSPDLCPAKALPKLAKGRCAYRPLRKRPFPRSAPQGRCGDYSPSCEAVTVVARAKVRQVRRLSTFVQGLTKAAGYDVPPPTVHAQLSQEWAAITRGRGYAPNFATWLLRCSHFATYWSSLPPLEWARDVLQYVKFDAEAHVRCEADHRQKLARFQVHQDSTSGCSRLGFRSMRPQPRPPFLCIPYEENQAAQLVCAESNDTGLYFVPMPRFVRIGQAASLDDTPVWVESIVETDANGPLLRLHSSHLPLPSAARFAQTSAACTADELNRVFVEFWAPIWCRDKGAARTDLSHWSIFLQNLPPAPPSAQALSVNMQDADLWAQQIRRLKNGRATGYCGFSPAELKTLPAAAVQHLAHLFARCEDCGFPRHLAQATVHILAKVDEPQHIGQGRPITVYATIYRLWSSIAARSILRQWATWLPESVRGCVPGRGAREVSLVIQVMIEEALMSGRALGGFSLDIIKCFNQLPRMPLRHLLLHLHVPPHIVEIWFQFLDCNTRFALFHGELGSPVASTTGAPEGDPLSVVGQIAICWALVASTSQPNTWPWVYVDNLTWLASETSLLSSMLRRATDFCDSLRLPVDWKKSFAWGTSREIRSFWSKALLPGCPADCRLQLVSEAKDLGVAFRFDRLGGLGKAASRIAEGLQRLKRLQRQHRPLHNAAHLVQTGIWPAAFYGLEGHHVPEAKVDQLRSGAARAICGENHSMSPHLALSCLNAAILDPAVYLLVQALCALRGLLRAIPEFGQKWLRFASDPLLEPRRVIGPATALAKQLRAQGWVLKTNGVLKGAGHWHLCLFTSTPRQIRKACQAAWIEALPDRIGHRNGLQSTACPCPRIMSRVLHKFPHGAQLHLARSVVGGFLSRAARASFDPLVEKACPYCGDADTKAHRLLQCPATQSVRQPFQALLNWIGDNNPHWIHAPFPVAHPDEGFLRLLWGSRILPSPPCVRPLLDRQGARVHDFFTDGSCIHPTCPSARHAAWSVVMHQPCNSVPDLRLLLDEPKLLPAVFPVVAQGLLPGEQTIYRAEVAALVQTAIIATDHPEHVFHVWADSSSALRTLQAWLDCSPEEAPPPSPAGDILALLPARRPCNLALHKVKSHQNLREAPPTELLYALGNHVADTAAKAAEKDDLPGLRNQLDSVAQWCGEQEENLFAFFQYLLEVTKAVANLRSGLDQQVADNSWAEADEAGRLQQWCALNGPEQRYFLPPAGPADPTRAIQQQTAWPPQFLHCLYSWSQQLRWPAADATFTPHKLAGITFLELLTNFVVCTGRLPPVQLKSGTALQWIELTDATGILHPVVLRDVLLGFLAAVRCLDKALGVRCWPSQRHHRLHCLRLFGHRDGRKGLLLRPLLPQALSTGDLVAKIATSCCGEVLRDFALKWRPPS